METVAHESDAHRAETEAADLAFEVAGHAEQIEALADALCDAVHHGECPGKDNARRAQSLSVTLANLAEETMKLATKLRQVVEGAA